MKSHVLGVWTLPFGGLISRKSTSRVFGFYKWLGLLACRVQHRFFQTVFKSCPSVGSSCLFFGLLSLGMSWIPHLRGSFLWVRLGSGPLHPGGLYLGWGQGPTPNTAFGDRMGSSSPPGVESICIHMN
uniref:Uncharacterized protein n=1 Tax=Brassica oleracea var. oleracea TaxID=109376 RepID=A0A0D3ARG1_BRAOL